MKEIEVTQEEYDTIWSSAADPKHQLWIAYGRPALWLTVETAVVNGQTYVIQCDVAYGGMRVKQDGNVIDSTKGKSIIRPDFIVLDQEYHDCPKWVYLPWDASVRKDG